MGANLIGLKTEAVRADATGCRPEAGADLVAGEVAQVGSAGEVGVDIGGGRGAGVGEDALYDCCPSADRAKQGIAREVHDDCLVALFVLLELERDGDGVGQCQERVVMAECPVVANELDVAQAETFGPTLPGDSKVFARPHGEEERPAGQLVCGAVEFAIVIAAEFAEDARRKSLLGFCRGVIVFVAFQLVR